ncbi:hypothetical protein D3C80_1855440 [compost metagenome]
MALDTKKPAHGGLSIHGEGRKNTASHSGLIVPCSPPSSHERKPSVDQLAHAAFDRRQHWSTASVVPLPLPRQSGSSLRTSR